MSLFHRCEYVVEACQYGCGQKYLRSAIQLHQRDECINRPIEIKFESFVRITNKKLLTQEREICELKIAEQRLTQTINEMKQVSCFEVIEENVYFDKGVWRLYQILPKGEWFDLLDRMKQTGVGVVLPNITSAEKPFVKIKGERRIIEISKQMIAKLESLVKTTTITTSNSCHGNNRYGNQRSIIKAIEDEFQVCIETKERNEQCFNDDGKQSCSQPIDDMKPVCVGRTSKGQFINVFIADITTFNKAEIIVNPSNEYLKHTSTISHAITDCGGPVIIQDTEKYIQVNGNLAVGSAVIFPKIGNLPLSYKAIVHAVCPQWNQFVSNEKQASSLRKTVRSCLKLARNYSSIAIPVIGSGVNGFPASICANVLVNGTIEYLDTDSDCKLNNINFIVFEDNLTVFIKAMKEFREEFESVQIFRGDDQVPSTPTTRKKVIIPLLPFDMTLQVTQGDITCENIDVLVNFTNIDLQLGGDVATGLLTRGGADIQSACDTLRTQGIKGADGKVVETRCEGMGQLQCKSIFHVIYEGKDPKKLVKTIVHCLERAEKMKYSSIAFPPLWNKDSSYTLAKLIESIEKALIQFTGRTWPQHVKVIILQQEMLQDFTKVLNKSNSKLNHPAITVDVTSQPLEQSTDTETVPSNRNYETDIVVYGSNDESIKAAEKSIIEQLQ